MDLVALINQLLADVVDGRNFIDRFANNPASQFGIRPELFLGATILPERDIDGNVVEDENLRYRAVIANDAARYSPVQLKEGAALFGSMLAKLAESDIGKEFTAQQYDDIRKLLGRGGTMQAQARFLGWLDREVNQALLRKNEKQRWDAIVDASVDRLGDNSYAETVAYPDPADHRVEVANDWEAMTGGVSDDDPFEDILTVFETARDENIIFSRIIFSSKVQFKLLRNTFVADRARFGNVGFIPPNDEVLRGPVAIPQLASVFQSMGLPAPEIFDGKYEDYDGSHRYLHEEKMVFVGTTGTGEEIVPEDGDTFFVSDTLGYMAIGTPAGQDNPGRVINVEVIDKKKPPRIEVEGSQTALPVILAPEQLFVLDTTAP